MSDISVKISKIIAKADSTTNPEEAETFMAKAQQLMMEHGLSLLDLGRLDSDDPVAVDKDAWSHSASYGFMTKVASAAARYYGVEWCRMRHGKDMVYSVAGRESARVTFMLMLPYLEREIKRVARIAFNEGHYSSRMQAATRCGNALALRIWSMAREEHVTKHRGEGLNALVPVDLVEQALAEAFPSMRKGRGGKVTVDAAARKAVEGISLHRQTGAAPASRMISR